MHDRKLCCYAVIDERSVVEGCVTTIVAGAVELQLHLLHYGLGCSYPSELLL